MKLYPFDFEEISDTKNHPLLKKFIFDKKLALIYGFTINFDLKKITSLLMPSSIPTCDLRNQNLITQFHDYIKTQEVSINHGRNVFSMSVKDLRKARFSLCELIGDNLPLYVIFWNLDEVLLYKPLTDQTKLMTREEFAKFYGDLKSVKYQSKPIMYSTKNYFEKLLNSYGVTGAGDLDGFTISGGKPCFFEFSTKNTGCDEVKSHNPNTYINEDWRRWEAYLMWKNIIPESEMNVVIWGTSCRDFLRVLGGINLEHNNGNYKLTWENNIFYE